MDHPEKNIPLKLAWLCSFANPAILERLGAKKSTEFAPWINNLIGMFENRNDIELHIIAPNIVNRKTVSFTLNAVHYHFYNYLGCMPARIFNKLRINERTDFMPVKRQVKKIMDRIRPDILHLHGAENPVYSAAFLPLIDTYKTILTVQGFIFLDQNADNPVIKSRKKIELEILKKCRNFGVRTEDMCNVIKAMNPGAAFFWHNYPITKPGLDGLSIKPEKEYDCAFFARVSPENSPEDLLHALSLVKKTKPDISLLVVGPIGGQAYREQLESLCTTLDILPNVTFRGFMPTQQQAFQEVVKCKMDVLPTYYDIIPGTILECMYLGVPVISYAVGGIPELNRDRESILLVKKGDVQGLANKILFLLEDEARGKELSENARETVKPYFDNEKIYRDLLSIYKILSN